MTYHVVLPRPQHVSHTFGDLILEFLQLVGHPREDPVHILPGESAALNEHLVGACVDERCVPHYRYVDFGLQHSLTARHLELK